MADMTFDIVDERISSLESIGVEEGCTTTTSSSSLDISDVDFE